jgi:DNA-binding GntR family transcriptional regulator
MAEDFDVEFGKELVDYIKKNTGLKYLYKRLEIESNIMENLVEFAKKGQLDTNYLGQLKEVNAKFSKSKNNIIQLANIDKTFHDILSRMAGDTRLQDIQIDITLADGDPTKIWQSIRANEIDFQELCSIHTEIIDSIEKPDREEAVKAMRKHFIRVLPHYIQQTLNSKSSGNK